MTTAGRGTTAATARAARAPAVRGTAVAQGSRGRFGTRLRGPQDGVQTRFAWGGGRVGGAIQIGEDGVDDRNGEAHRGMARGQRMFRGLRDGMKSVVAGEGGGAGGAEMFGEERVVGRTWVVVGRQYRIESGMGLGGSGGGGRLSEAGSGGVIINRGRVSAARRPRQVGAAGGDDGRDGVKGGRGDHGDRRGGGEAEVHGGTRGGLVGGGQSGGADRGTDMERGGQGDSGRFLSVPAGGTLVGRGGGGGREGGSDIYNIRSRGGFYRGGSSGRGTRSGGRTVSGDGHHFIIDRVMDWAEEEAELVDYEEAEGFEEEVFEEDILDDIFDEDYLL